MAEYALYVESGPKHRKTQVHVFTPVEGRGLDLLGCTANGPTTEAALAATPDAIRAYLAFLKAHGEKSADPSTKFTTKVAAHVMEGTWMGNGDPDPGFAPDFQPLTAADHTTYLKHLTWMQEDLLTLARTIPSKQLVAKPAEGRTIRHILEHVAGAQYGYLQSPLSKPEGMSRAVRMVEEGPDIAAAFDAVWQLTKSRLEAMTEAERTQQAKHGVKTATARRIFRRLLEHDWEHLVEIKRRLR